MSFRLLSLILGCGYSASAQYCAKKLQRDTAATDSKIHSLFGTTETPSGCQQVTAKQTLSHVIDSSTLHPHLPNVRELTPMANRQFNHRYRFLLAIMLIACVLTMPGCIGALSQLIYTIRGHRIDAEFDGLNGKRIAVVCVSDASAYGPDTLTYTISQAVGIRLVNGLKKDSQVIAPSKIEEWIDNNGWNETEYVELGKGVDADMVLAIEVAAYSLTEGSTLFKGRSDVTLTVYDIKKDGQVPYSATPMHFAFPRNGRPSIQTSEREFEAFYLSQLTTMIANKFVPHDKLETFANDATMLIN